MLIIYDNSLNLNNSTWPFDSSLIKFLDVSLNSDCDFSFEAY